MATKNTVTLQPDLGYVNEFNRVASGYGNSLMVSFDVKNDKDVDFTYEKRESVFAAETDRDYNFAGLMFSREHGMFYFYPDSAQVFIPLLDARNYFAKMVQDVLNIKVNLPTEALDGLFQHLKFSGSVQPAEAPNELLESVLSYYAEGSKQRTVTGRLLYNEYSGGSVSVSTDEFARFSCSFTHNIMELASAFNKVLASVTKRTDDGLLNTNMNVQKAISHVFDSTEFSNLEKSVASSDDDENGFSILSANFFFNSVVRDYYDRTFYKNGNRKAAKSPVMDQLNTVVTGMNAADIMAHPASGIITALGQFASPVSATLSDYDDDYVLPDVASANNVFMNTKEINRLMKVYNGNADAAVVQTALDSIETKKETLENPSVYVMTDRVVRAMTDILKMMTGQKIKDNTRYTK